jgi:hypothetical protein
MNINTQSIIEELILQVALLPKLMKGEIRVKGIRTIIEGEQ